MFYIADDGMIPETFSIKNYPATSIDIYIFIKSRLKQPIDVPNFEHVIII